MARQSKIALRWDANLESNLFNKLCDELVGEILVRLPTTAAVRFQAVCKRCPSFFFGELAMEDFDCFIISPLTLEQHIGGTPLVAYRGMLHWLNADCILVYDPLNTPEKFYRVIHLPIQLHPLDYYRNNCFGVSKGCLRVTGISGEDTVNRDPVLDVWELEDYDSGLWKLVHKVPLKNLIHYEFLESLRTELRHCFLVISFHPENGDLIYLRLSSEVILVNMKSRIIERFYPIDDMAGFCWADAFHLVDQWWPTALSLRH
nr:F-box protein At5g07610-like [Ipomoea trifida]